jgi:hypothetical protein
MAAWPVEVCAPSGFGVAVSSTKAGAFGSVSAAGRGGVSVGVSTMISSVRDREDERQPEVKLRVKGQG